MCSMSGMCSGGCDMVCLLLKSSSVCLGPAKAAIKLHAQHCVFNFLPN
jgi:hypothetical protein